MSLPKSSRNVRQWMVAWVPLAALLATGLFSTLIVNSVITCGLPEREVQRRCIPHEPDVTSVITAGHTVVSRPFAELRGRLTWSISMLFFAFTITATLVMILKSSIDACRSLRLPFKTVMLITIGLFLVMAALMGVLLGWGQSLDFNKQFLTTTVYRIASAEPFVTAVVAMAPVSLVGLAISVSLILLRSNSMSNNKLSLQARVNALGSDQRRVRLLLYVGALALVAGTLQASALYSWAGTMLDLRNYGYAADITNTMGILNGSFYSILLAGIFAPAMVQLRVQARSLAEEAKPDVPAAERNKWLDENGIAGTVPRQLYSALAVAGPLIAGGPIVALLELVGS